MNRDLQDPRVRRVTWDYQDQLGLEDPMAHRDHKDLKDLLVTKDSKVYLISC